MTGMPPLKTTGSYVDSANDRLYVSADLNIYGSENGTGIISVERRASSNSDSEARDKGEADRIQLEIVR